MPLCATGLPRIYVRQAVHDKRVISADVGTCSGYWRCVGVCRTAGVAHLQEIRTAYAFRFVALFSADHQSADATAARVRPYLSVHFALPARGALPRHAHRGDVSRKDRRSGYHTEQITERPAHPYTHRLLEATPEVLA